jgi:hypothetical protein
MVHVWDILSRMLWIWEFLEKEFVHLFGTPYQKSNKKHKKSVLPSK